MTDKIKVSDIITAYKDGYRAGIGEVRLTLHLKVIALEESLTMDLIKEMLQNLEDEIAERQGTVKDHDRFNKFLYKK